MIVRFVFDVLNLRKRGIYHAKHVKDSRILLKTRTLKGWCYRVINVQMFLSGALLVIIVIVVIGATLVRHDHLRMQGTFRFVQQQYLKYRTAPLQLDVAQRVFHKLSHDSSRLLGVRGSNYFWWSAYALLIEYTLALNAEHLDNNACLVCGTLTEHQRFWRAGPVSATEMFWLEFFHDGTKWMLWIDDTMAVKGGNPNLATVYCYPGDKFYNLGKVHIYEYYPSALVAETYQNCLEAE